MKKHLLSQAAALCLLAPSAALLSLPANAATANEIAAAPQTRGLEVNANNGVAAGSQLRLVLDATPGGRASARLPGLDAPLALRETAPGRYAGRYTVRASDRIDPGAIIKVSLTANGRTAVGNFTFPASFLAPVASVQAPVIAIAPPLVVVQPMVLPLRIERFAVAPLGRAEPGAELQFRLDGLPDSTAWIEIPGVVARVPLREIRPGRYEGSYTVRRQDDLAAAGPVTATLRSNDNRLVTATLSQPLVNDNRPPQIGNLLPRQGEAVGSGPTLVSGSFNDGTPGGVDPESVRIRVSGRDVTSMAQITPREFSWRDRLPPGRHTVEVTAADRAGNVAQKSWSFEVGGTAVMGAPMAALPLSVMSHQNNGQIGREVTVIRGRTAPFATVQVRVDAISPTGGRAQTGVAQRLLSESVQADANGEFSVDFSPRYVRENASVLPVPGTRYDVSISANRDNASSEAKLMLFQRS